MIELLNFLWVFLASLSDIFSERPGRIPLQFASHKTQISSSSNIMPLELSPCYANSISLGNFSNGSQVYHPTMSLLLYTSQSFLIEQCPHFINVTCADEGCTMKNKSSTQIYPQFVVQGQEIQTQVSFGQWNNNTFTMNYADECQMIPWADEVYSGGIGLGVADGLNNSFQSNVFSLYVNEGSEASADLIFGVDWFKKSIQSLETFTGVSMNWEINYTSVSFGPSFSLNFEGAAIMDLNMGYIVVPLTIYNNIISFLKSNYSLTCSRDYNGVISVLATCTFKGSLPPLPTFTLAASNGTIEIMPSIYLGQISGNTVPLLIVPSTIVIDYMAVLVNPEYQNYTILGMPFLNYYYVVFDFTEIPNNKIELYQSYSGLLDSPVSFTLVFGGSGLVLLICCCGCCYYSKKRADRAKKEQQRAFLRHKQNFEMDESKFI